MTSIFDKPPVETTPNKLSTMERMRKAAKTRLGRAAMVGAALPLLAVAVDHLHDGSSQRVQGLEYSHSQELALGKVIKPEMQRIAEAAVNLQKRYPDQAVVIRKSGTTEIEMINTNSYDGPDKGLNSIDVVMRNYPGTKIPNPANALFEDITTDLNPSNDDPAGGVFSDKELQYTAPGGEAWASQNTHLYNQTVDRNWKGWSAFTANITGTNGRVDTDNSGTVDTTNHNAYPMGATNSVAAANVINSIAPDSLSLLMDSFKPSPQPPQ